MTKDAGSAFVEFGGAESGGVVGHGVFGGGFLVEGGGEGDLLQPGQGDVDVGGAGLAGGEYGREFGDSGWVGSPVRERSG
ncbi:hypothetical protein [Gordonia sp. NPDC003376]